MDAIRKALINFGLSEKESQIYMSLLEIGESSAGEISLKSSIPRTLTYDILNKLMEKGLVTHTIKNKKKFYLAADSSEFSRILSEKQRQINSVLNQMRELQKINMPKRPTIEIYYGKEGMKTLMDFILRNTKKEFYGYGSSRSSYEIIPAFMEDWHHRRIKNKMWMKVIYNNTPETRKKLKERKDSLIYVDFKLMPIHIESPTATVIFEEYVALQSWGREPFAVVIKCKELADNQKEYFKELWKIARKV